MEVPLGKAKVSVVAELAGLEKGLKSAKTKIEAIAGVTKKATDRANKHWDKAGKHIDKATSHLQGFQTKLLGLGAGYVTKRIASDFLSVAESFEAMETQLDVLTKGQGTAVLDELNKWALDMPVNTQKVVDSFRLMTAMGLDPMMATIETLTDVSSIFGDDVLQRLALQLGQASAKGKIMAQDLNIMAEAGINARGYIKDAFNMTLEEVQNSGIEIEKILESIFTGMEKEFGGSAKKMMGTWRGLKTVTKSYFVEIQRSVMSAGIFEELKMQLSDINDTMKNWLDVNRDIIDQKVPEYIDDFKESAKELWAVINYDPDILKYGLLGLALGGKKGAVLFGGAAHILKTFQNTVKGAQSVVEDEISFLEFATSNFKELEAKLDSIEHKKTRSPIIARLENERDAIVKSIKEFEDDLNFAKGGFIPDEMWNGLAELIKDLKIAEDKIKEAMTPIKKAKVVDNKSVIDAIANTKREAKAAKALALAEKQVIKEREASLIKYNKFILDNLDETTDEYQSKYIDSEMERWSKVKGLTQDELDNINFIIIDSLKEVEKAESFFKGVAENFTTAIQTEMSGIFTDLLTGDLDNFEDYFQSFTASLTQMWGQMAAKMVMTQSMWSAGNFAALGGAGIALAGISKVLGDRSERKAKEKARKQLGLQTQEQISGSLAQLELSEFDFQIFEMNKKFEEMSSSLRGARLPLDDLIKLRGLETKAMIEQAQAGFTNLQGGISDFITGKQRQEWGVADWQREFGVLSDELMSLNQNADDYNDKNLELLTDQFEILKNIEAIQENQLRNLENTSQSLVAQAVGLQTSEGMPISRPYFESRYDELLTAALLPDAETGMLNTTDIAFFQGFVNDYINTMSMLGDDYQGLIDKSSSDLLSINDAVQSEIEELTKAIDFNTDATKLNSGWMEKQFDALSTTINNVADTAGFEAWLKLAPETATARGDQIDLAGAYDFFLSHTVSGGSSFLDKEQLKAGERKIEDYSKLLLGWAEEATTATKSTEAWKMFNQWAESFVTLTTSSGVENFAAMLEKLSAIPDIPTIQDITEQDNNASAISSPQPMAKSVSSENIKVMQPINLTIDGQTLSSVMIDLSRSNPEFKQMLTQAVQ